jgi:hypothetical protein
MTIRFAPERAAKADLGRVPGKEESGTAQLAARSMAWGAFPAVSCAVWDGKVSGSRQEVTLRR